jgi:hypothetical protein
MGTIRIQTKTTAGNTRKRASQTRQGIRGQGTQGQLGQHQTSKNIRDREEQHQGEDKKRMEDQNNSKRASIMQ